MGAFCLVSRNFGAPDPGPGRAKGREKAARLPSGFRQLSASYEPHNANSIDALRDGASFPGAVV